MKTQDEIFQKTLLSLQHSVPPQLRAGGSRGEHALLLGVGEDNHISWLQFPHSSTMEGEE